MNVQSKTRTGHQTRRAAAAGPTGGYRLTRWAVGVLLLALLAAIVVTVVRSMGTSDETPGAPTGAVIAPEGLTQTGSIRVGRPQAPVTVALYFDYLCPACGAFESANGAELTRLLEAGTIQVELRPMAFLDRLSDGTVYSTRAANALATVADAAPGRVWSFHGALYAEQPAEGGPGLTDETISGLATGAGVPAAVAARFAEGRYEPWVAATTARAFDAGVEGTPTILVDGHRFEGDPYTVGPLTEMIEQAAGDR